MSASSRHLQPIAWALVLGGAVTAELARMLRHGAASGLDFPLGLFVLISLVVAWFGGLRWRAQARRAAEEQARQRSIIEGAGEAVIVIDDQAIIRTFNRAAERMFGYAAAEMIGTSLERLMTDGGRQAHAAYLAQNGVTAMVEAARLRTVHKGVRKRGDVFPFELTMTEWSDQGRRMFTGVMRDVTEHERAVDALRESKARFNSLYESSPDPLFIYALAGDGGFVLESMNRAAEDYTGLSRYAVAGAAPDELAAPEQARSLKRALLECVSSAAIAAQEVCIEREGETRRLRLTLSPMRDASGEIRRVLASGRDVPHQESPEQAPAQVA